MSSDNGHGEIPAHLRAPAPTPPVVDLRFIGAADLRAQTPEEPEWLWKDYIATGSLVIPGGKPKAGKSTLIMALSEAMVLGAGTFLGRPVRSGKVVYVSEEAAITLRHKLPQTNDLVVLTREGAWPKPTWAQLVTAATEQAKAQGAVMLVIDTFAYWAQLAPEREQDAGATGEAIGKLVAAAAAGIAVVLVHHQRKGGGEEGEGLRGSGAIAGSCDMILEVERVEGDAPKTHRQLVALGRWPETPDVLIVDWDKATGSWQVIGEAESRHETGPKMWATRLEECVGRNPGVTITELEELLGSVRKEWNQAMQNLLREGRIERLGLGRKGAPYRHYPPTPEAVGEFRGDGPTESHGRPSDSVGNSVVNVVDGIHHGNESVPVVGTVPRKEPVDDDWLNHT